LEATKRTAQWVESFFKRKDFQKKFNGMGGAVYPYGSTVETLRVEPYRSVDSKAWVEPQKLPQ
jgi:hypothetical protein